MIKPTPSSSDEIDTKERILRVAMKLFSLKGYRGTSVASICEQAQVNVAAVNYHFHSKLELYIQIWKVALERDSQSNPHDGGVPADAPAEERLRGRVRSLVKRFVRPNAPSELAMLIIHELADPTDPAIDEVRINAIQPPHTAMRELIREMLGENATEREVLFTTMGVFIPVFGLGLQQQSVYRRYRDSNGDGEKIQAKLPGAVLREAIQEEGGYDALIDHIITTTLAGIKAVRIGIQERQTS
ncbi:MAG: CerR family C-terminal domain-containing protein [Phycisphaerales bacterium]